MKKITKRIMAFMLSLVMILGCIPSFINEVSASAPHTLTINGVTAGAKIGDMEVLLDSTDISEKINLTLNSFPVPSEDTFEDGKTYVFTLELGKVSGIGSDGDSLSFVAGEGSFIDGPDSFTENQNGSNRYKFFMGKVSFSINIKVKETYHIAINNAVAGGSKDQLELLLDGVKLDYGELYDEDGSSAFTEFEVGKKYYATYTFNNPVFKPVQTIAGDNSNIFLELCKTVDGSPSSYANECGYEFVGSPDNYYSYLGTAEFTICDTEGSITASPLTAGTKVKDINLTLDFGDNVFTENYCYAVFDNSVGPEGKLLSDDDSLEAGKTYQLLVILAMEDVDNYETVIFNGETLTEEENYLIDSQEKELRAWIDFALEPALTSHGSKKYKATDSKDTAEKITGTGKKGSTRTIVPEKGRKVSSVVVIDKDGNKIDVTMNADGTYSFVQPASNVDVQVNYKNREITLNIGSTEASVDNEKTNLDVCPVLRNDRTMLPIRFVAENLGAKVEWSEKNANYVVITRGDTKIEITLGSDIMKVNGKDVKLDSVAFAENDRTYLPVRAISEALNAIVEWNENEPSVVKIYERQ